MQFYLFKKNTYMNVPLKALIEMFDIISPTYKQFLKIGLIVIRKNETYSFQTGKKKPAHQGLPSHTAKLKNIYFLNHPMLSK